MSEPFAPYPHQSNPLPLPAGTDLADHQLQGTALLLLGEVMTSQTQQCRVPLRRDGAEIGSAGFVTVSAEEVEACNQYLKLRLWGHKLMNTEGFFGTSDPFFEIHRAREDGTWVPLYRSVHIKNSLNPKWPVARRISMQALCNGDKSRCPQG